MQWPTSLAVWCHMHASRDKTNMLMQDHSNPVEAYELMYRERGLKALSNSSLVVMIKEQGVLEGLGGMADQHSCTDKLAWLTMMARLGQTAKPTGMIIYLLCTVLFHAYTPCVASQCSRIVSICSAKACIRLCSCCSAVRMNAHQLLLLARLRHCVLAAAVAKRRRLRQVQHPLCAMCMLSSEQVQQLATMWPSS